MSNLTEHAKRELESIGAFSKEDDFYGGMTGTSVMELVELFAKQGHSGMSASLVRNLFNKLADYKPLKPITCEESEWGETISEDEYYQNKRCYSVFKEGEDGKPYYIDAICWKTQTGSTWTGSAKDKDGNIIKSRQFIKLPFIPKTFIIDVEEIEIGKDDFDFVIKDMKQLEEVFEYYQK